MLRTLFVTGVAAGCLVTLYAPAARAQSLPQGLTCGLSYQDTGDNDFDISACNGYDTMVYPPQTQPPFPPPPSYLNPAPGFAAFTDGDWDSNVGYMHQELQSGAVYPADSTHFVLPQGAACGFHHTYVTPGHTCMGFNPARAFADIHEDGTGLAGCPTGWTARRAFDMSSGNHYFVWCEYQDPNHLSQGSPTVAVSGIACGISDNDPTLGMASGCMGYTVWDRRSEGGPNCPGMWSSNWSDAGEPSGIGLGYCNTGSTLPPYYTPPVCPPKTCPHGTAWDSDTCQCECTSC